MPGLSDTELKKRLEAHNYQVPPITATTRGLLQKKLAQLDAEFHKSNKAKSRKTTPASTSLIDYSSAEEEQSSTKTDNASSRRRTSTSSRNSNASRNDFPASHMISDSSRSVRNNSRSNTPQKSRVVSTRQTTNGTSNNGLSKQTSQHTLPYHNLSSNGTSALNTGRKSTRNSGLIHFSENEEEESEEEAEDESEEDEEEEDVDDEDLDDEEEELEDEEHSYEEEEEDEEVQFTGGVNLGIQTSPGLDDTVDSGNLNGGGPRFRAVSNSGSSRFISSTPTPTVKSTSAYFSTPQPPDSNLGGHSKSKPAFPVNSPLRRHVAGNNKAFGSLGEVLASLPMGSQRTTTGLSHPSTTWSSNPSSHNSSISQTLSYASSTSTNNYVPTLGGTPVSAADLTTQVGRSSSHHTNAQTTSSVDAYNLNNRSRYCTSQNISKLIVLMAGVFFLVLSYKYATLRPSIDIERLVCLETNEDSGNNDNVMNYNVRPTCVPKELENAVTNITRDIVNILETRSVDVLCNENLENAKNNSMTVSEILQVFIQNNAENESENSNEGELKYQNEYDLRSNGFENNAYTNTNDDEEDLDEQINTKKALQDIGSSNYHSLVDKPLRANIQLILTLIYENPQWGIKISGDVKRPSPKTDINGQAASLEDEEENVKQDNQNSFSFDETFLSVNNPPMDWECWLRIWASTMYSLILYLLINLTYLAIVAIVIYGAYRMYCWRQEKQIREQQDVFELVEQVLSMLVAQHQQYHALAVAANVNVSQASGTSNVAAKPCVAVNHIRDQLIPPTDRKRKQHIWTRVVKYIRESESRVREDVQTIYGEEHLVWQWIPDIHWSPMTHTGPNPYPYSTPPRLQPSSANHSGAILPPHGMVASAPSFHLSTSNTGSPHMMTPTMPSNFKHSMPHPNSTSTPITSPSGTPSASWQGAAFNSLNRNVAAPTIAPTSCLKIRHMFDPQHARMNSPRTSNSTGGSNPNWIWQVKEEILRRCAATSPPAAILHIAVDTENAEGCVYVKAQNTEEAGKVFRILHGQWYRGNLVTVKYLREERYHERFPDAKNQRIPLRASIQLQRL